jgi:hypothetical protein
LTAGRVGAAFLGRWVTRVKAPSAVNLKGCGGVCVLVKSVRILSPDGVVAIVGSVVLTG